MERETDSDRDRGREETVVKKLAHTVTGTGKSKIYSAGQQAVDAGKSLCCTLRSENDQKVKFLGYLNPFS